MNFGSLEAFVAVCLGMDFKSTYALEFYDYGSVLSQILFRSGQFQAELFMIRPNIGFPRDHRHPDVDSIEYCMSERVPLFVNGDDLSNGVGNWGRLYHVGPDDWHRVGDVPNGGTFLSLQKWNGRAPTSVGLNWEGTPVSEEHRRLLRRPDAIWIKTISKAIHANPS
jgi:hypothetical protein